MTLLIAFWSLYITLPLALCFAARAGARRSSGASTSPGVPLCGRCAYDVRNLPTNICPECGSDLDRVGRRTSGQLTRRRWLGRLFPIAFTFLMLFAGFLFAMAALFSFSPRRQVGRMISPRTAFIGNAPARWPFTITEETQWDRDESPHVFGNWYPERARVDRLTSDLPSPIYQLKSMRPSNDPALQWDSLHGNWSCGSALLVVKSGAGFPSTDVLRTWAGDIVTRHPAPAPLTRAEMEGLVVAIGDLLASSDRRRVGPQWGVDRAALIAAGAANVTFVHLGGSFHNTILPLWWPTATVSTEWFVLALLSFKELMRRQRSNFQQA